MKKGLLVVLAFVMALFAEGSREGDSLALVAIRDANPGSGLDTLWHTAPIEAWDGVDIEDGRVTLLHFGPKDTISSIPPEIGNLSQLKGLGITVSTFHELPVEFSNLTSMAELFFEESNFNNFSSAITNLTNLNALYISSMNNTLSIPKDIRKLGNLEYLIIHAKNIPSFTAEILDLSNLTALELASLEGFIEIPRAIDKLSRLTRLEIYCSELSSIPAEIGNLSNLEELRIKVSQIESLPSTIGNLTQLKRLDLRKNQLTAIPATIGNLKNLTYLVLSDNNLYTLPQEILNLSDTISIDVDNNFLSANTLSSNIVEWLNIKDYNWAQTQKTELTNDSLALLAIADANPLFKFVWSPFLSVREWKGVTLKTIGDSKRVYELDLTNAGITTIPSEITELTELTNLELDSNSLFTLPPEIMELDGLIWNEIFGDTTFLNIKGNYLSRDHLPDSIAEWLDIHLMFWESKQKELPTSGIGADSISLLALNFINPENTLSWDISTSYKTWEGVTYDTIVDGILRLNLENKGISVLPPNINAFNKLGDLNVSGNNLIKLPESITNMSFLKSLDISDNELILLPENITNLIPRTLLDVGNNKMNEIYFTEEVIVWLDKYDPDWRDTQNDPSSIETVATVQRKPLSAQFTGGSIQFSTAVPAETKVSLFDFSGREIFSGAVQGRSVAVPPLARGIYLMQVKAAAFAKTMKLTIN